jgi:hypothetical protein
MKPLGRKAYGSIPHLPNSRVVPGDQWHASEKIAPHSRRTSCQRFTEFLRCIWEFEIIMNIEKLEEIYQLLKSEDAKALEWGQPQSSLPSTILAETLIRCSSKEFTIGLLRHISARLERTE